MKFQYILTFILLTCTLALSAQDRTGFSYQGVARDAEGDFIENSQIAIRLSVMTDDGTVVYEEEHTSVMTNDYGVFNLIAGQGTPMIGTFSEIDWANDDYSLEVGLDINPGDGINYIVMGQSPVLSVPYAFYSEYTANVNDADADPTNEIQTLSIDAGSVVLSHGGGSFPIPPIPVTWWEVDDAANEHLNNTNIGAIQLGEPGIAKSYLTINQQYGIPGGQLFLTSTDGSSAMNMSFDKQGDDFEFYQFRSSMVNGTPTLGIWQGTEIGGLVQTPMWKLSDEFYGMTSYRRASISDELRILRGPSNDLSLLSMTYYFDENTQGSRSWNTYATDVIETPSLQTTFVELFDGGGAAAIKSTELTVIDNEPNFKVYGKIEGETAQFTLDEAPTVPTDLVYANAPQAAYGLHADIDQGHAAVGGHGGDIAIGVEGGSEDGVGGLFYSFGNGVALATTSGNVGFGTTTPDKYRVRINHASYGLNIQNMTTENNWEFWTNGMDEGHLELYYNEDFKGAFHAIDGSYGAPSDIRLKSDVSDLEPVMDKISRMRPRKYQYCADPNTQLYSIGFIAQELQEIFPETVFESGGRDEEYLAIKYDALIPVAIKAIQEQQALIEDQQKEIKSLEKRIEKLENLIYK